MDKKLIHQRVEAIQHWLRFIKDDLVKDYIEKNLIAIRHELEREVFNPMV